MPIIGHLGRTHFTLDAHRAFIQGHGEQVTVFPCLQCPCLTADRQFDPLCQSCHGMGRFYPPATAFSTWMLLQADQSERTMQDPGSWVSGTVRATLLPEITVADRDKVRRMARKTIFTDEVLLRGDDETLRFSAGVELLLVADRTRTYVQGVDYALGTPNTVTWLPGGQAPGFMQQYSCRYLAYPDFLVYPDHGRERAEHGIGLSQVVLLHRLDMISEEG